MSRTRSVWMAAALGVLGAACAPKEPAYVEERLLAMATWVDIAAVTSRRDDALAAIAEAQAMLRGFERDYYAWGSGELAMLNAAIARQAPFKASPELAALLHSARTLSGISEGLFDPGVGGLVELWGFHSAHTLRDTPPSPEGIAEQLANGSSIADLRIDGTQITSSSAALKIDLGGIAKGAAVDRIIAILRRHGIHDALVNAGGDLRVLGRRQDRPWRIGIMQPRGDGVLGAIELSDGEAAFTSGDYERYFEHGGRRFHHLLDPTTGWPVTHTQAVTVIGEDGAVADAAATALFVAGRERWRAIARSMGIDDVLRVDASGEIELTASMARRLTQAGSKPADIMLHRS